MIANTMAERLYAEKTFEGAITRMLHDVVALHGAEFGDVQLPIDAELVIVAQTGLDASFLRAFMRVDRDDGSACGRALRERRTVVISDVECDPEYEAFRPDARKAGYRAVQTTPLFASDCNLIGMVSTLFASVHEPTPIEMETLMGYSVRAADYLQKLLKGATLRSKAAEMNLRLCAQFGLNEEGGEHRIAIGPQIAISGTE